MKKCCHCKIEINNTNSHKSSKLCKACSYNYQKKYRENNKDKVREDGRNRMKKWRDENYDVYKEKHRISSYNWYIENKDHALSKRKVNDNYRYKNDILFRMKNNIRNSINLSFSKNGYSKTSRTQEILGCSYEEFKTYLESKFEPWMNWENKGLYNGSFNYGWDIDHIIPISSATNEEELIKLNHYTNLQPLCSKVNRDIKKDTIEYSKT